MLHIAQPRPNLVVRSGGYIIVLFLTQKGYLHGREMHTYTRDRQHASLSNLHKFIISLNTQVSCFLCTPQAWR